MNTINILNEGFKNKYLKESATPYGGDKKNFYMFYVGPTSGSVGRKDVIDFAKKHGCDSIYWASSDATGYKASYNGDTLVIFNKEDINEMPDDYKEDAKKYGKAITESFSLKEDNNKPEADIENRLIKYFNDNKFNAYNELYTQELPDGTFKVSFDINWGDWKHEHLRADYLVKNFILDNDDLALVKMWDEPGPDTGEDVYDAKHVYIIRK